MREIKQRLFRIIHKESRGVSFIEAKDEDEVAECIYRDYDKDPVIVSEVLEYGRYKRIGICSNKKYKELIEKEAEEDDQNI
jgi:uncharacterized protein YuzB (UPF0349 family)